MSLLDIHVWPPSGPRQSPEEGPLEILEAGTGHGGLTLHLARAIQGANGSPPALPSVSAASNELPQDEVALSSTEATAPVTGTDQAELAEQARIEEIKTWKSQRNAILHTIELRPEHSHHARNIVRNFRHGLYYPHVDFHTGSVVDWIRDELARRASAPFLAHILLDLPAAHDHLATVAQALRPNGKLIVFNPNITQIATCVETIRTKNLPFQLDKVLELGSGVGTAGREWDVRSVKPRAVLRAAAEAVTATSAHPPPPPTTTLRERWKQIQRNRLLVDSAAATGTIPPDANTPQNEDITSPTLTPTPPLPSPPPPPPPTENRDDHDHLSSGWELVCKPMASARVTLGGFIGMWSKT